MDGNQLNGGLNNINGQGNPVQGNPVQGNPGPAGPEPVVQGPAVPGVQIPGANPGNNIINPDNNINNPDNNIINPANNINNPANNANNPANNANNPANNINNPATLGYQLAGYIKSQKDSLKADNPNLTFEERISRMARIAALERSLAKEKKWYNIPHDLTMRNAYHNITTNNDSDRFKENIESVKTRFRTIYNKLSYKKDRILPANIWEYAHSTPSFNTFTDEVAGSLKDEILKKDPDSINLYANHVLDPTETLYSALEKELNFPKNSGFSENRMKLVNFFGTSLPQYNNEEHKTFLSEIADNSKRTHFVPGRPQTDTSNFIIYLMGREKDSYSYEEAQKIVPGHEKFEAEMANYRQFLKDNITSDKVATRNENGNKVDYVVEKINDADAARGVKAWADIYINCANKLKSIKFPDIDYTNPDELARHHAFLTDLAEFTVDFNQNINPFLSSTPAKYFDQFPGKRPGIMAATNHVEYLRAFLTNYAKAYNIHESSRITGFKDMNMYLKQLAGDRAAFGMNANIKLRGKTVEEISKPSAEMIIISYGAPMLGPSMLMSPDLTREKAVAFLKREPNDYMQTAQRIYDDWFKQNRTEFVNSQQVIQAKSAAEEVGSALSAGIKEKCRNLFRPDISAEELYAQINSEDGVAVTTLGSQMFRVLFEQMNQADLVKVGNLNPLDMIKIDGKSLETLYGEKYAFIQNPNDKEKMYQAELVNEILNGNSNITFDHYVIDENLQIVPHGSIPLFGSAKTMESYRKFLKNIKELHDEMADIYGAENMRFITPEEGARQEYDNMRTALQKCITDSRLEGQCNYTSLKSDWQAYTDCVNRFYTKQEQLMRANGADEAAIRNLGEDKKGDLGKLQSKIDKAEEFAKYNKIEPGENEALTPNVYTFSILKSRMETMSKVRLGKALSLDQPLAVYEGDLAWVNGLQSAPPMSVENYRKFNSKFKLDGVADYAQRRIRLSKNISERPDFKSNPTMVNADERIHSLFVMWALSNNKININQINELAAGEIKDSQGNVLNAAQLAHIRELQNEFYEFTRQNPFFKQDNATPEEEARRVSAWMKVFKDVKQCVENYVIPDADFEDINQVSPHLEKLLELKALGLEGVQEWERMVKEIGILNAVKAHEGVENGIQSDKEFREIRKFYGNLQTLFGVAVMPGFYKDGDAQPDNKTIAMKVLSRHDTAKMLQPFRGKTVGQFMQEKQGDLLTLDEYTTERDTVMLVDPENAVPVNLSVGYAMGINGDAYETACKRIDREAGKRAKATLNKNAIGGLYDFRKGCLTAEAVRILKETPDDVQSMKALFNRKLEEKEAGQTVLDIFVKSLDKDISKFINDYLVNQNLNRSDLFYIDGKTPSELWGEKYADVASPDEKEFLYLLEIAKSIAKGDKKIEMRNFALKDNNEIQEVKKEVVFLQRNQMQAILDGVGEYEGERDNLLSELKDIRKTLITTHDKDHKNSNFFDTSITGSDYYQAMCSALKNAITILEKDKRDGEENPAEIKRKLTALETASATYYRERRGIFFRPITDDGTTRLEMSEKMKEGLTARFDRIRQPFNNNVLAYEKSFKDSTYRKAWSGIKNSSESCGLTLHEEENYYKNKVIKRELNNKLRILKTYPSVRNMENDSKELKAAKRYLIGFFEMCNLAPEAGAGSMTQDTEVLRMMEHFDEKAKELSKNPVFQRMMEKNPEDCIKRFYEIEKEEERLYDHYVEEENKFTTVFADAAHYALGITNQDKEAGVTVLSKIQEIEESDEPEILLRAHYANAGKTLLIQLLSEDTDRAKFYRQEIAADPKRYDDLLSKAVRYLVNERALEANKASFSTKCTEEKYMNLFVKQLKNSEELKRKEDSILDNQTKQQNRTGLNFLLVDFANQNVTEDNFKEYTKQLHIDDLKKGMQSVKDAAGYLNLAFVFTREGNNINEPVDPQVYEKAFGNANGKLDVFLLYYAMSEKNMSMEEAISLSQVVPKMNNEGTMTNREEYERASGLRYDFYQFCKEHALYDPEQSKDRFVQNVNAWAKVYKDGSAKILSGKMPSINYRSEKEITENIAKLYTIHNLIQADQNFDMLFNVNVHNENAGDLAVKAVGGEKAYNEIYASKLLLSSRLKSLDLGYLKLDGFKRETYVDYPVDNLRNVTVAHAATRCMAKQTLNSLAGRTFAEIVNVEKAKGLFENKTTDQVRNDIINHFETVETYYPNIGPNEAVNYLLETDTAVFEKAVNKRVAPAERRTKNEGYLNQRRNLLNFRKSSTNEVAFERLKGTNDDAESMINFLNAEVSPVEGSGLVWLNNAMLHLFKDDTRKLCLAAGIKPVDLFEIDGKKPEEIWGEKYAHIQDEKTRQSLYLLEIMKSKGKADREIRIRNFAVNEKNELTEKAPALVMTKKAECQRLYDNYRIYDQGMEAMRKELNSFKAVLQATQTDVEKNFNPDQGVEGDAEYKAMTASLKNLLDCIAKDNFQNGNITVERFTRSFDNLIEKSAMYADAHSGDKKGDALRRLETAEKMKAAAARMKETYLRLRKGLESDLVCGEKDTFKDASYYNVSRTIKDVKTFLSLEDKTPVTYRDEFVKQEMNARLNKLKTQSVTVNPQNQEAYDNARKYLVAYYQNKVDEGTFTMDNLLKFDDTFNERLNTLSKNRVFQQVMKIRTLDDAVQIWDTVETNANLIKQQNVTNLQNIANTSGSVRAFVAGIQKNANELPENLKRRATASAYNLVRAHENRRNIVNYDAEPFNDMYERLAEAVVVQILSGDTILAKQAREIAGYAEMNGPQHKDAKLNEFTKNCEHILRTYEALSVKNVEKALNQLESGKLAEDMEKEYIQAVMNTREEQRNRNNQINNENQINNRIDNQINNQIENVIPDDNNNIIQPVPEQIFVNPDNNNNDNLIHNGDNLIQNNDNLIQNNDNLIQNNGNPIQNNDNPIQNNDNLIQNKDDLMKLDENAELKRSASFKKGGPRPGL